MNIYVGNLSFDETETSLKEAFAAHGDVTTARIITDRETGRSRGFGFVEMSDQTQAQAAIAALNGTNLSGRDLTVNEAKPREKRQHAAATPREGTRGRDPHLRHQHGRGPSPRWRRHPRALEAAAPGPGDQGERRRRAVGVLSCQRPIESPRGIGSPIRLRRDVRFPV